MRVRFVGFLGIPFFLSRLFFLVERWRGVFCEFSFWIDDGLCWVLLVCGWVSSLYFKFAKGFVLDGKVHGVFFDGRRGFC